MRIFSDVDDHVFAIQVLHKRDDPKLPYQAVVIRQSAIHLKRQEMPGRTETVWILTQV